MNENELGALRRANPVDADAVDELVSRHRSALGDAIGSPPPAARRRGLSLADTSGEKHTRFSPIGIAAVTIAMLALPAMLIATIGRNDGVNTPDPNLPQLDELPLPDELGPDSNDELFLPVPTDDSAAPSVTTTTTTAPPTRSDTTPPATTAPSQPDIAAAAGDTTVPISTQAPATQPPGDDASSDASTPPTAPTTTAAARPATTPDAVGSTTTTTVAPNTGTTNEPPAPNDASQPLDPARDLLVVTFDFANDDDHHASVASREVATSLALDPLVIAGTQTADSPVYVFDYVPVMTATWGDDWIDAAVDRTGAVSEAADRWLSTIDGGGVVRIAEGGVSDFTAEILREVQQQRPLLDTTSVVYVVHHIQRNVSFTRDGDIDFLQASTTYVRIDDGNNANGTADLELESPLLESAALTGQHADGWTVAFAQRGADRLDFSDTVTVLDIVGIAVETVADPDDFVTAFMS